MNILISSLGTNYEIVEEALGLFNYSAFDLYKGKLNEKQVEKLRTELGLISGKCIDEVWVLTTDRTQTERTLPDGRIVRCNTAKEDLECLRSSEAKFGVKYRMAVLDGVADINNEQDATAFHDMVLRVTALAHRLKGDGKVYMSLACGRKTMSADIQDAAYCFGCDGLMHVLGDNINEALPLSLGKVDKNEAISTDDLQVDYSILDDNLKHKPSEDVLKKIEYDKAQSQHFFTTYYLSNNNRANFYILYTLPPSKIEQLKNEKIGIDPAKKEEELEYLRRLPKTELHCHLGGVLDPEDMVEVAKCYAEEIDKEKENNEEYAKWLEQLPQLCKSMRKAPESWKKWLECLANKYDVHKSLIATPFLIQFEHNIEKLESLIYDDNIDEQKFNQIGIDSYEALGDLQGSTLLCNEKAIRKTVQTILNKCIRENVKYLELRCSPLNYETKKLSPSKIMLTILEELDKEKERIKSSVLIIASRHGEVSKIEKNFKLAKSMKGNELFKQYFRGFDLAGSEREREAKDLRDYFLEAMKECYNITIHAGENVESESIWQAVYCLNAERIGHGLSLIERADLMNKFLERGIGIEMCPSSNFQIVGFKDNYYPEETSSQNRYPLKNYLDLELRVSVNTDDPGISRTNITYELLRAARMTEGGLSKWDILQLLCNGFRTAFYPYDKKRELIENAEKALAELITNDKL